LLKARKKQHVLAGAPTIIIHQQLLGWLNVRTPPFPLMLGGEPIYGTGFGDPVPAKSVAVRSVPEWRGVPCAPKQ